MRALLGAAAAIVALGVLPLAVAAPQESGMHGYVRKGPVQPTCPGGDEPCDVPAAGVTLTFTRDDGLKAKAVTRSTGFYRVLLRPGRYTVTADVFRPQTFAGKSVRLLENKDARVDFHIDTGRQ